MTNAHHGEATRLVLKHKWKEVASQQMTAELLDPPRDCHTYNDVCFKGEITSLWWKYISPCVIIIGPHCSYLHCAWLQFSHSSQRLKGWFQGIDSATFVIVTNFLIATFIISTSHNAWLIVLSSNSKVPAGQSLNSTHDSFMFLFNIFLCREWFVYLDCMHKVSVPPPRVQTIQSYILISRCLLGLWAIVKNSALPFFFFFF